MKNPCSRIKSKHTKAVQNAVAIPQKHIIQTTIINIYLFHAKNLLKNKNNYVIINDENNDGRISAFIFLRFV